MLSFVEKQTKVPPLRKEKNISVSLV
jgi:hypothetical protein